MGNKTYAIGDIHGQFDLLGRALAKIKEQTQDGSKPHTVVFLGDYIDRGRKSSNVVGRLRMGPSGAAKWVCIQGNHEAMMINTIKYGKGASMWLANGGNATLLGYGAMAGMSMKEAAEYVIKADLDWMMSLPILHADRHRVYVHAYIDRDRSLYQQRPNRVQWELWPSGDDGDYNGLHIVHGHEQREDGPLLLDGRTNLDTGAYYTGRLCVGVFDDEVPGGPIGIFEIR